MREQTYTIPSTLNHVALSLSEEASLLVNGAFPGPTIEANWGDTIQVTVTNNITEPEEGAALHWHGLLQKGTPYEDGVPGITQCPIAPGETFTYSFLADLYGTSWYHSHYSAQYAAGLFGAMIIYGPPHAQYDEDLGPVLLSDHYHGDYYSILQEVMGTDLSKIAPLSDNNLINGKGIYNCSSVSDNSTCTANAGLSKFKFTSGKTYLLRLINPSSEAIQRFSIDGHALTVIAYDFVPIVPYTTQVVTLGVGQRAEVIVHANGSSTSSYWMRSNISETCSLTNQPYGLAIINYQSANTSAEPDSTIWPIDDTACGNDALNTTVPLAPITPPTTNTTVDIELNILINGSGNFLWTMDGSSFRTDYNAPILLLADTGNDSYPAHPEWNVYNFGSNNSFVIVINNTTPLVHPMHIHGHNFFVLNEGVGSWDGTTVRATNPMRRDVQLLQPSGNILELPFRKTHSVELALAIKRYISQHYDQSPAQFADDLQAIDALREDAVHVLEPHVSGIARLQRYAAQLQYLSGKFPIDIGVEFPWYPAIGYHTTKAVLQNNLRYELANILFNLAALYSQLAYHGNRTTSEGLKQAAQHDIAAAGTLSFLRTDIIPDMRATPPEDMDGPTLQSLEQMCLAQAQECFWLKAVKDGMKDGTIARLAAKVSDYYSAAGDWAVKSDAISTEWIHHFAAKHHHFAAAAQYRMSVDCLEKRKYGEEVARLRDSIACVNEALKEQRWINRIVLADLQGLKSKVTEELKRAEKDNDVLYLLPVPPKTELKLLDRANMVKSKTPTAVTDAISMLGPTQPFGIPLFEKLVPYAVHQAASIYEDRRDRLVNQSIVADLESMTAKIQGTLQSLGLPGSLQAVEKPLGLPPTLVSKAEELKQQDALYRIKRSLEDTTKLKTNDLAIYQEGVALLEAEREEDDAGRSKFGTDRWTRPPSKVALAKLYQQSTELQGYLNSAGSSDSLVQAKIRDNEHMLQIMTGSNRDLESYVPSSRNVHLTPTIESASRALRTQLNEISRLETRRKRKIEALRAKAKNDDISPALLTEAARLEREFPMQPISAAQFEPLFDSRLAEYDGEQADLETEQEGQDQLLAKLREANKAFEQARREELSSSSGPVRAREKALQNLEMAYVKYREIISNLDTGRKFYNDLASHVSRFRDECQKQVAARRIEKSELETELVSGDVGRLNLEEMRQELRNQKVREAHQANGISAGNVTDDEPMTAPVPQKVSGGSQSAASARAGSHREAGPAAVAEEQSNMYAWYPPPQLQDTSTIALGAPLDSSATPAVSSHTMRSAFASNASSTSRTGPSRSGGESARPIQNHAATGSRGGQTTHSEPRTRRLVSRTARLASQVASKRQLTIAFSITFVIAAIIYLALFLSHTIKGTLFHVMSIILLVSLLAVTVHSAIRWVMVKEEYKQAKEIRDRKRKPPRERGWVIGRPYEVKIGGRPVEDDDVEQRSVLGDDEVPREGIRVYMREDEGDIEAGLGGMMDDRAAVGDNARLRHEGADLGDVLRGVNEEVPRSRVEGMAGPIDEAKLTAQQRMNPNHMYVHAAPVLPTPSTPTYDEAMSQRGNATPYGLAPAATAATAGSVRAD
ncbi:hypothetical protein DV737_g2539, partial [Chaetothyriales sp. CBS 132003]